MFLRLKKIDSVKYSYFTHFIFKHLLTSRIQNVSIEKKGEKMSRYNKSFGGLKVNIKGKVSSQQIIETLATNLIVLQENFGVEEFSGVNFYCQIYKDGESQALVHNESENILSGTTSEADSSYRTITEQEDGSKVYRYEKGINFEEFKIKTQEQVEKTFINEDRYSIMSKSEIEASIERKENELRMLQKARERQYEEDRAIRLEKEKIKEDELNKFREQVKIDFYIEEDQFKTRVSSIGALIAPHTIKKYLGKDIEIDDKYYRVTMKNEETGKAGYIYIYDVNYKLVKKIVK